MAALIRPEKIATNNPNLKLYSATAAFFSFLGQFAFLAHAGAADQNDAEQRNQHAAARLARSR